MDVAAAVERPKDEYVFQFASGVTEFSSQYGCDSAVPYTANNIRGRPLNFPKNGDFFQTFAMRTYGPWKDHFQSRKCPIMPQNFAQIESDDFIIVSFQTPVIPLTVSIFETYAPGSIVCISAKVVNAPEKSAWRLLWQGLPQVCNVRRTRLFVPQIKYIKELVNELCIEFNHSQLKYYTQLDAVSLGGLLKLPESGELEHLSLPLLVHLKCTNYGFLYDTYDKQNKDVPDSLTKLFKNVCGIESVDTLNIDQTYKLPDETLLNIFSYLDLKSLRLCMRVCKRFNKIGKDNFLYSELNFKPYWSSFTSSALRSFEKYCSRLTKLDLSWCGIIKEKPNPSFVKFIKKCGKNLTHLRLDNCGFVNDITFITINSFCKHLKELSLRNCTFIDFVQIPKLKEFSQMEHIDFYRTTIDTNSLELYLKSMPKLKHINLGSCVNLSTMDHIAGLLGNYNKKLVSIDFWNSYSLTVVGLSCLFVLKDLEEIDIGCCSNLRNPGNSIVGLARACRKLKKIGLTSVRDVSDQDMSLFADNCLLLEHVELAGVKTITRESGSLLLMKCGHLRFLDVNCCEFITELDIFEWRMNYPKVSIQYISPYRMLVM